MESAQDALLSPVIVTGLKVGTISAAVMIQLLWYHIIGIWFSTPGCSHARLYIRFNLKIQVYG